MDPKSLTVWWEEMSFSALWHCHTIGDVVLSAWRTFKAAWLSEQILMYFSDRIVYWIHKHMSKWCIYQPGRLENLPREMLSLIPKVHPKNPAPLLYCVLDPSVLHTYEPFNYRSIIQCWILQLLLYIFLLNSCDFWQLLVSIWQVIQLLNFHMCTVVFTNINVWQQKWVAFKCGRNKLSKSNRSKSLCHYNII